MQVVELLRFDGGFPPVAVHLLQAGFLVHGLCRALALGCGLLDHGGECREVFAMACVRKKMKEKEVRKNEWKVTVKKEKG